MAFNMGSYQSAADTGRDIEESRQEAIGKAAEKQADTEKFKLDKSVEFRKKAEKAAKKFGSWKNLGMLAGVIGMGFGLGPLALAALQGGGTLVGGMVGKKQAEKELGGGRWFKGNRKAMLEGMESSILQDTIMSGITGAVAGGMGGGDVLGKGVQATSGAGTTATTAGNLWKGTGGGFKFKNIAQGFTNLTGGSAVLQGGSTLMSTLGMTKKTQEDPLAGYGI